MGHTAEFRVFLVVLLLATGFAVPTAESQVIDPSRGRDRRVDYRIISEFAPWDDRNYDLTEEDIELLARSGAGVATCVASNMKLGAGIAPVTEKAASGITIGLGTDSCASNNRLDLFHEMTLCAKLHKVHHHDPTVLPARQVLQMATINGAAVLGLADRVGTLAPGKCADIIIIDLQQPHLVPFYNSDLLVYGASGSDVVSAIINGQLVMHKRQILTFDVEEAMARVRELSRPLR